MGKLTSKRQVTIPQSVCEKLELEPGDTIKIFERDGIAHIVKMSDKPLAGQITCPETVAANFKALDIKKTIKSKAAKKFRSKNDCC